MDTYKSKLDLLFSIKDLFMSHVTLLRSFINVPDSTVDSILTDTEHPLYEKAKELKIGLDGEFTRHTAITIGIKVILEHFDVLKNLHAATYLEVTAANNLPGSVLKFTADGINKLDLAAIKELKEQYSKNELTERYYTNNVNDLLNEKAMTDTDSNATVVDYIQRLFKLADMVKNSAKIDYAEVISIHEDIRNEIKDIVNNTDTLINTVVNDIPVSELNTGDMLDVIKERLGSVQTATRNDTLVLVISELIDSLPSLHAQVLIDADEYLAAESKLNLTDNDVQASLNKIYDDLIMPLTQYALTDDEFESKYTVLINNIDAYSGFMYSTLFNLISIVNTLRFNLVYTEYIYDVLVSTKQCVLNSVDIT